MTVKTLIRITPWKKNLLVMKKLLITCLVFSTIAPSLLSAAPALLSDLIDGSFSYQSGNKTFSNFTYTASSEMPPASEITVDAIPNGIRFLGDFQDSFGGATADSLFTFDVDFGGDLVTRAILEADLSVVGSSGIASITETFLPTQPDRSMTIFDFGSGGAVLIDTVDFDPPVASLNIQKDLILSASSADTTVGMTFFDQTFIVPEPEFGLIFAIGAIAIVLAFRRIQRKA